MFYNFTEELGLSKYVFDENHNVYRVGKVSTRLLKLDMQGNYWLTKDNGKRMTLSIINVEGFVQRMRGDFNTRKRMMAPFNNYEITRDGRVYLYFLPMHEIGRENHHVRLRDTNGNRTWINTVELVSRYFSYKDLKYRDLSYGFMVTNITATHKLTSNPSRTNLWWKYISQKNTVIVTDRRRNGDLHIVTGLSGIIINVNSGDVFISKTGVKLETIIGDDFKTYKLPIYDYSRRESIIQKFKVIKDYENGLLNPRAVMVYN